MGILLREEDGSRFRPPETDLRRSDVYISICAWCRKANVGSDWFELEEAMRILGVFAPSLSPRLTHGMCSSCRDEMRKELEKFSAGHNEAKFHHQPHHASERTP